MTGMRISEILELTIDCVDLKEGKVIVNKQLHKSVDGTYSLSLTKTKNSRVIYLDKMATEAVISTLTKQKEYSKQPNWCNTMNLVFTTEQGRNLCIQTVEKPFKRIVRKLGLSEMRIHDLRHTFATRCLANGDSIMSVSAQLGHSNVSTTVNIYSHTTDEMLKESAHRRSQQNEKLLKSEPEKKTGKVPKNKKQKK